LQRRVDVREKNVGIVVSGGNIDLTRFADMLLSGEPKPRP
jgi:threonine dehydratase